MFVVEVRVPNLDRDGCIPRIKKSIFQLKGVKEIEIGMKEQKITVRGYFLEQKKVLRAIRRVGGTAKPWLYPSNHSHFSLFYKYTTSTTSNHYYDTAKNFAPPHMNALFHPALSSRDVVGDEYAPRPTNGCSIM